ncbi:MAG: glycosyltransferase [Candidatus Eisenbacteria bacterium]|nr:glycosyltransferase [Candidatus Eisenbacteria bacterium]
MRGERVSVVIPVRNAERTIEGTLRAIAALTTPPDEVVLVDDGCTDGTIEKARPFGCRVVPSREPGGVAAARNTGAAEATGGILLFVDADVELDPGALDAALGTLGDPDVHVAVGLQSPRSVFPNAASVYKNLWLHYTYKERAKRVSVIYSSAVAIRREAYERVGGFDTNYKTPNIEDSDLGKRITEAGFRMAVSPGLRFLHIKRYSVASMIRTDFHRTVGMMKVQIRDRFRRIYHENYTSIPTSFLISCLAPWTAIPLGVLFGAAPALLAPPLLALILNHHWLRFVAGSGGTRLALAGVPLLFLDILSVNLGAIWGALDYLRGKTY